MRRIPVSKPWLLLAICVWVLADIQSLFGQAKTTQDIIGLAEQSNQTNAQVRSTARSEIAASRDQLIATLMASLREEQEAHTIHKISTALHTLVAPWVEIPDHVHGHSGQIQLCRHPESMNADLSRPVRNRHSVELRRVLLEKLDVMLKEEVLARNAINPEEYDALKSRHWSDCNSAIHSLCRCLQDIAEFEDLKVLKELMQRQISEPVMNCVEDILGIPGLCGARFAGCGVMPQSEHERVKRSELATVEQWQQDLLELLVEMEGLDRKAIIREAVRRYEPYLTQEQTLSQFRHAGVQVGYWYRLSRFGPDALEAVQEAWNVNEDDQSKARYEILRAEIAGDFDRDFVEDILSGERTFEADRLFAINIIVTANSTDYREQLLTLLNTETLGKDDNKHDLFRLRMNAAQALAGLHGVDVIEELESVVLDDPSVPGAFNPVVYIVRELKLRYSSR